MMRKGQAKRVAGSDARGQAQFVDTGMRCKDYFLARECFECLSPGGEPERGRVQSKNTRDNLTFTSIFSRHIKDVGIHQFLLRLSTSHYLDKHRLRIEHF